jgi:hypothetical protein
LYEKFFKATQTEYTCDAEMKKTAIALSLILALLFSVATGAQLVNLAKANPYSITGEVPPDSETFPPAISISTPKNNTVYSMNRLPLVFNVTAPQSRTASETSILRVTYQADWMDKTVNFNIGQGQASLSLQFSNIPEGSHRIIIQALGGGLYVDVKGLSYKEFRISSSSEIRFSIDTIPPTITIRETQNTTSEQGYPLDFMVNETISTVSYVLDNNQNVTIGGNTTLHDLPIGEHNLTVYAWDLAGNVGKSETTLFTVQVPVPILSEPFATVPVAAAAVAIFALALVLSLLLFKRHRKTANLSK